MEDGARGILSVFFVVFRRDVDLVGVFLGKVVVFGLIGTGFLPNEEEEAVEGVALLRREGVTTVGGGGGGGVGVGVVVVSFRTGGTGDGGGAAVVVVVVAAGASFLEKVAILWPSTSSVTRTGASADPVRRVVTVISFFDGGSVTTVRSWSLAILRDFPRSTGITT